MRPSGLVEAFEKEQATALQAYSPDQIRKWRNPKKRAIANLIAVVGDKAMTDITRADTLAFRDHRRERVLAGDVDVGTAHKDIGHISKMLRTKMRRGSGYPRKPSTGFAWKARGRANGPPMMRLSSRTSSSRKTR